MQLCPGGGGESWVGVSWEFAVGFQVGLLLLQEPRPFHKSAPPAPAGCWQGASGLPVGDPEGNYLSMAAGSA